jgi:hypothetical protein
MTARERERLGQQLWEAGGILPGDPELVRDGRLPGDPEAARAVLQKARSLLELLSTHEKGDKLNKSKHPDLLGGWCVCPKQFIEVRNEVLVIVQELCLWLADELDQRNSLEHRRRRGPRDWHARLEQRHAELDKLIEIDKLTGVGIRTPEEYHRELLDQHPDLVRKSKGKGFIDPDLMMRTYWRSKRLERRHAAIDKLIEEGITKPEEIFKALLKQDPDLVRKGKGKGFINPDLMMKTYWRSKKKPQE